MTPEGGATGVNLGWTRGYGDGSVQLRNLDRIALPRFKRLQSPAEPPNARNLEKKGNDTV
jgi:hypothetical protein